MRVPWAGGGDALRFDMVSRLQNVQDVGTRSQEQHGCDFPRATLDAKMRLPEFLFELFLFLAR